MQPAVSLYDRDGIEQLRRTLRIDPQCIRGVRRRMLKRFDSDEAALAGFPAADRLRLHPLAVAGRFDSRGDGATKLLLRTADGHLIESVVMRIATGRSTVCISTQVGCGVACRFCATGRMGLARNLGADEVLDQVVLAGQLLRREGRRLRNIVCMGMGEPFHNEANLHPALDTLLSADHFAHPATRITVSTVGVPDALVRCAERFPHVRLALSLHSARQSVRERLIPLARKHSLDDLRRALWAVQRTSRSPVMIEYLLLSGVNDSPADAEELAQWLNGLNVHVNLIPYNPIDAAAGLAGSDRTTRLAFAGRIRGAGFKTTIRYSLGGDIAAACGQLAGEIERGREQAAAIAAGGIA